MSICAIIPVASLDAANSTLETAGFGPRNFSVPAYGATGATHAALHAWGDPAFVAAVKATPGVVWEESEGDPVSRTQALIAAQGAKWGDQAPALPTTGNVTAGIAVEEIKGASVVGNRVTQDAGNTTTLFGIYMPSTATGGTVTDNDCTGAGTTNVNSISVSSGTNTVSNNKRRDGTLVP